MSRRVVPTAVLGVAGGLLFAAQACSSISTSPGSHDAGRADVVQGDSANKPIDGGPDGSLGVLAVVNVPDSPCVPKGGISTELYSTAQDPPGLDRLSRVGTRRVAEGSGQNGFFTFDLDGGNASDAATSLAGLYNVSASEGATIGMIASDGTTLSYQRYDAQGATVGPVLALGTGALTGVTFAGGGGAALAAWGSGGAVWARGIGTAGTLAGPAFTIDAQAFKNDLTVAAAYDGTSSFAVVWSGDAVGSRYRMRFGIASPTGIAGMRDITLTGTYNEITRLVKTPQGYALLLGVSDVGRTPVPYLLLLGNDGAPRRRR